MTDIIMVRHGESEANRMKVFAGNFDADLTETGMEQALKTARYIADNYKVDKVYASDLKRAYKTGKCVADLMGIEIIPDEKLREISAGEWEGKKFDDILKLYRKDYEVWLSDIGNARCTGGESTAELLERIMTELTIIAEENKGKTVLIATHATPIRVMQTAIQHKSLMNMQNVKWVQNASVNIFGYSEGRWSIKLLNENAHLGDIKTKLPANV